jgi:hypothetical protein
VPRNERSAPLFWLTYREARRLVGVVTIGASSLPHRDAEYSPAHGIGGAFRGPASKTAAAAFSKAHRPTFA